MATQASSLNQNSLLINASGLSEARESDLQLLFNNLIGFGP